MITKEEKMYINGSGLFFFKSKLTEEKQLEILKWYRALPKWQQEYVDTLIQEGKDDADFFSNDY